MIKLDRSPTENSISKDYLLSLIDGLSDIILRIDSRFNIIYYNKEAAKFYSISSFSDLARVKKRLIKLSITEADFIMAKNQGEFIKELSLRNDLGSSIYCSVKIICHPKDQFHQTFTLVIKDISALKKIEAAIFSKKEELNRFIYRISHDIRGPVASMLGLYNLVNNDISDQVSLKYFELYQSQAERLNNIILSLFKHAAIENGVNQDEQFTIAELISQIETGLKIIPKFANATINKEILDVLLQGDRFGVFTILHSLIDNSAKFLSPYRKGKIDISAYEKDNFLVLEVKDNGVGIDIQCQAEMFKMFYRGNTLSQGSGLGLYLFKIATDKLEGEFHFASEVDEGTHFIISIPLNQSHLFRK